MKQKLTELKGEIDNSKTTVEDFKTPLSVMDQTTRQQINKKIEHGDCIMNQLGLHIHRALHPATEYIFFSSVPGTFSRIGDVRP